VGLTDNTINENEKLYRNLRQLQNKLQKQLKLDWARSFVFAQPKELFSLTAEINVVSIPTLDRLLSKNVPQYTRVFKYQHSGETRTLLDTGATVNVINESIARKKYKIIYKRHKSIVTNTANGQISLKYFVKDTILYQDRLVNVILFLLPNLTQKIILGQNTLRQLGFHLIQVTNDGTIVFPTFRHDSDLTHMSLDEDDTFFTRIDYEQSVSVQ